MYVATDIGGTHARVVAYPSLAGTEPLGNESFFMTGGLGSDFRADYNNLVAAIAKLRSQYGPVEGIGLAVAGKVDRDRSQLVFAGNLAHWVDKPIVDRLTNDLNCRVMLGNDAEALALAESVYGLGTHEDYDGEDFIGMIWGSGIGGACVRYLDSANTRLTIPMEPGHVSLVSNGWMQCGGCDDFGHLEAYCGGANLAKRFDGTSAEKLSEYQWIEVLSDMVNGMKTILNVQPVRLIIFSGGIACKQPWLLEELEKALTHPRYGSPKIRLSAFGESAGTLGALSLLSM